MQTVFKLSHQIFHLNEASYASHTDFNFEPWVSVFWKRKHCLTCFKFVCHIRPQRDTRRKGWRLWQIEHRLTRSHMESFITRNTIEQLSTESGRTRSCSQTIQVFLFRVFDFLSQLTQPLLDFISFEKIFYEGKKKAWFDSSRLLFRQTGTVLVCFVSLELFFLCFFDRLCFLLL